MVQETITDVLAVDLSAVDFETPSAPVKGIVFCTIDGDVAVEWPNGVTTSKSLTAGEYWRVSPSKILKTGTTATVQFHI